MALTAYMPSLRPGISALRDTLGLRMPADELHIFVGTASPSWTAAMADAISSATRVRIRVGLDIPTPARTGELLSELSKAIGRDIQLIRHTDSVTYFHPKIYVAKHRDLVTALVGSSNASSGAFQRNVEANVVISGARGSREEALIDEMTDSLEGDLNTRASKHEIVRFHLPEELPIWQPVRRRTPTAVAAPSGEDAWQTAPGYLSALLVADFYAPISGLSTYVLGTSNQGGFDIEDSQIPAVEAIIPQGEGAMLELAWRFIAPSGRTIFSFNDEPRMVRQSGYGGNNRVITTTMRTVAKPCWEALQAASVTTGEAHVLYKLEKIADRPDRLWMVHTVPVPGEAELGEDA